MTIKGIQVDEQTRCIHYHSPLDIIAIKFKCCYEYYSCYYCHQEQAGHPARVWSKTEFDSMAVLCGSCKHEMSISLYHECEYTCPFCHAAFNPRCFTHNHLYFEE